MRAHPSRTYLEGGKRLQGDETCSDLLEALSHALRLNVRLGVGGPLPPLRLDPLLELLLLLRQRPQSLSLEITDCLIVLNHKVSLINLDTYVFGLAI